MFTINSFMAPVTSTSVARTDVGDWLFGLDERWAIEHFEIDPEVHRCPLIRNFPKGIGLVARRLKDEHEFAKLQEAASWDAKLVWMEDWAGIAANECSATDPGRPERLLGRAVIGPNSQGISSQRLATLTDYIGHFNIDSGKDGPFFRLWNDWRLNSCERSAALLMAYMAMVGKSDLKRRCTKEELLLLKRLPQLPLQLEYANFIDSTVKIGVNHNGDWLTDQEACDRAQEHKRAGEFEEAELLWSKVAAVYPAHGDCWFQLAQLLEIRGALPLAAVFAAHSVQLGCNYYAEAAERMRDAFFASTKTTWTQEAKLLLSRWVKRSELMPTDNLDETLVDCCREYFDVEAGEAIVKLARWQRVAGNEVGALSLERAVLFYK